MYGLENVGIVLEIFGFVLLLPEYIIRFVLFLVKAYKKELNKPAQAGDIRTELGFLDYNTYKSTHRKTRNIQDVGIILIIFGLILQIK